MSQKHLYRSVTDRKIAGVAGGLAEYFQVDPSLVRLLWLLSVFIGGSGVLAYLVAWIAIPEKPSINEPGSENFENSETSGNPGDSERQRRYYLLGLLLIAIGLFFLVKQFLPWDLSRYTWPFILIALGVILLIPRRRNVD